MVVHDAKVLVGQHTSMVCSRLRLLLLLLLLSALLRARRMLGGAE